MSKYNNHFYNKMINKHPEQFDRRHDYYEDDEYDRVDECDDDDLCDECYEKKHGFTRNELVSSFEADTSREYFLYQADSSFMFRFNDEMEKILLIGSETGNFEDPGIAVETDVSSLYKFMEGEIDELQSISKISKNHYLKIVDQYVVFVDPETNRSFAFTYNAVQDFLFGCLRAEYIEE